MPCRIHRMTFGNIKFHLPIGFTREILSKSISELPSVFVHSAV